MGNVYTTAFLTVSGATGTVESAPVPAGYRWVVTNADFFIGNQIGSTSVRLLGRDGVNFFADQASEEVQTWFQWTGRHVLSAGSLVAVIVDGGNADVSISGFQLTLP